MAGSRVPGPTGINSEPQDLNDGTLKRGLSNRRGPTGIAAKHGSEQTATVVPMASTILDWETIKADMKMNEDLIQHMYLDSVNKVTVGVGNMMPTLASAQALGFVVSTGGAKASKEQIKTDWDKVIAESGKNKRASSFAKITLLDLPIDICWDLLRRRIYGEFLPELKKTFSDWDKFPTPAKRALLDMAYNLGMGGLKKFKIMISFVEKVDWEKAAGVCTRQGIPDDRNEWTRARFREAAPLKGKK